jgi:CheY-like chemotaxis protein
VYGIVRQSGGDVAVESSLGAGSAFRVMLPRDGADSPGAEKTGPEQAARPQAARAGGQPTILLVEDEEAVRAAAGRILVTAGYRVLVAASGAEALELFAQSPHPVELLLTDVVMPQMSGRALAEQLTAQRPDLKVAYMSGYLDDILGQHGVLPADLKFIGKPFAAPELTRLVTEVLAGAGTAPSAAQPRYTLPP